MLSIVLIASCVAIHTMAQSFPKLPSAFSSVVEANIMNTNSTAILTEMYDMNQQKSFRAFMSSSLNGNTMNILEMYASKQEWTWETTNTSTRPQKCKVKMTSSASFDGLLGIPSVKEIFGTGNTSTTMMNGTGTVRGIPCNVWVQSTVTNLVEATRNISVMYDTFYYFSMQPWTWFRPESAIPTRVIKRGTRVVTFANANPMETVSFEHYYEFVKFEQMARVDFTQVSTAVTSVDTHLCDTSAYCANAMYMSMPFCSVNRGPKMPAVPATFSTNLEMNFVTRNMTLNQFEAFDEEHKLLHVRATTDENSTHYLLAEMTGAGEVWEWDRKQGMTNPLECQVTTIKRSTNPTIDLFRHEHGAGPYYSQDLFSFGGAKVNETYIGQSVIRGIPVDGWYRYVVENATAFFHPNGTEEFRLDVFYYFSQNHWSYPPRPSSVVPVRIEFKGIAVEPEDPDHFHNIHYVYDYYDFRGGHDYADLSESFNHDSTHNEVHIGHGEEHEFLPPIDWIRQGLCNATSYCTNNPSKRAAVCTPAPRVMPSIPETFSTSVEVNFIDENRTAHMFEAFDGEHKVYHQRLVGKTDTHRLLADLSTNETWLWDTKNEFGDSTPLECVVTTAKQADPDFFLHLFLHSHDGRVYSSGDFFRFGKMFGTKYVGERVLRGIPVQVWSSRVIRNMTAMHAPYEMEQFDFEVLYYFSDPSKWRFGHLNETNLVPVPLRVHVKGTAKELETNPHSHAFEHIYEYSVFRAGHSEALLAESFNHDKTHNEMHAGHDEEHEFLPPIDWVNKRLCNTTKYCSGHPTPRAGVCSPNTTVSPQSTTLAGGSSGNNNSCNCKNDDTAAIVVGVVLGVLLLVALGVIFYLYNQKPNHSFRTGSTEME